MYQNVSKEQTIDYSITLFHNELQSSKGNEMKDEKCYQKSDDQSNEGKDDLQAIDQNNEAKSCLHFSIESYGDSDYLQLIENESDDLKVMGLETTDHDALNVISLKIFGYNYRRKQF